MSCGSDNTCDPGRQVGCTCDNGKQGVKTCSADGSHWGSCDCECQRNCTGRVCGDDGCGGSCGTCEKTQDCIDGQCLCIFETCMGECCDPGEKCSNGLCCLPSCGSKLCGSDGCGGECPPGCDPGQICDQQTWTCQTCVSDCNGKECGPDGCDGSCAPGCSHGYVCSQGLCEICVPDCTDRECGPDGCDGECPPGCDSTYNCNNNGKCIDSTQRTWITVNAGTFTMGSPPDEPGRFDSETQHEVTITRDFVILATEVQQGDFEAVMGYNPSELSDCGPDCPITDVTWHEAAAYTNALSASEGFESCYECTGNAPDTTCELNPKYMTPYDCHGYRLPTEAEWEYAARGGTLASTYNGNVDQDHLHCESPNAILDPIAWYCGNASMDIHSCGQKTPNPLGLFDMLGSEWEWCQDWYADYPAAAATDPWGVATGTEKVRRGGSYLDNGLDSRAARRRKLGPTWAGTNDGFRPVRTLP